MRFLPGTLVAMAMLLTAAPRVARAALRAGAPRILKVQLNLSGESGTAVGASTVSLSQGVLSTLGGPATDIDSWRLFFTGSSGGRRNLWQAAPEPAAQRDEAQSDLKRVVWNATPLTRLAPPLFAANPVPIPGARALLCVIGTGVANDANASSANLRGSQIVRLDLDSGRLTPLTSGNNVSNTAPAISPDGKRVAFVSDRSGLEAIYVMAIEGGSSQRVATMGRSPRWLDNQTVLFESMRPGGSGIYRVGATNDRPGGHLLELSPSARPRLLYATGGELSVSPQDQMLCIAAPPSHEAAASQLLLIAADGSGARAIGGTEGAASPSFTPDSSSIVFDAPAPGAVNSATKPAPHMLWVVPLLRTPPTALLSEVRLAKPASGGEGAQTLEVVGTAFSTDVGPLEARLEYGEGATPEQWSPLAIKHGPIQAGIISSWRPPADAHGLWTLRLTVTDADGDKAQSRYPVELPLTMPAVLAPQPLFPQSLPANINLPGQLGGPVEPAPLAARTPTPTATPTRPTSPPPPRYTPPRSTSPVRSPALPPVNRVPVPPARQSNVHPGAELPILPLPALPPPPGATENTAHDIYPPDNAGASSAATAGQPSLPPPDAVLNAPPPGWPPTDSSPATVSPRERPAASIPEPPATHHEAPRPAAAVVDVSGDGGSISADGVPREMRLGQTAAVTINVRNNGRRGWSTGDAQPVRLVYRWVNVETRTRMRWAFQWLNRSIAPGRSARVLFNLSTPSRPGRFRLTYALLRVPGTGHFEAPPYNADQSHWPGEICTVTYSVVVR